MDVGTALILGSTIAGGSQLAGGIIGASAKSKKAKPKTSLTLKQQQLNQVIMDFLLGIKRDPGSGLEISRYPLLDQMRNMPKPQYRVAPLTDMQTSLISRANTVGQRIGQRPLNTDYLSQLQQGILPTDKGFRPTSSKKLKYMAKGGKTNAPFVAGEAGKETITVDKPTVVIPSGTAKIKPDKKNLNSKKKLAIAIAKGMKASKATGLPSAATGSPRYLYETGGKKYYLNPEDLPTWDRPWDQNKDWADPLRNQYESQWKDKYSASPIQKWMSENPKPDISSYNGDVLKFRNDTSEWAKNWNKYLQSPEYQQAYKDYSSMSPAMIRFNTLYGGDITKVPGYMEVASAPEFSRQTLNPLDQQLLKSYYGGLNEYVTTQLPAQTTNTKLSSALGQLPQEQQAGFGQWLTNNMDKYGIDSQNQYRLVNGQYTFENPWNVDVGNVNQAVKDYLSSKGYTQSGQNGGWQAPAPETAPDWAGLQSKIGDSNIEDFNKFLDTYQGGAFAGQGIKFNRSTGNMEFDKSLPSNYYPGMSRAVEDYLAQKQNPTNGGTSPQPSGGESGTTGPSDNTPPTTPEQIPNALTPVIMGLATARFDPTNYNEEFTKGVYDPAMKQFTEHGKPSIRETFGGSNLFGTQRTKAEQKGLSDLQSTLASERAKYLSGQKNNFETRRLMAVNQAMELAQLPQSIANRKASTDYQKALSANVFDNMELRNAMTEADLTNSELASIATLLSIANIGKKQNDAKWAADFKNALTGPNGLDIGSILNLTMGTIHEPMMLYA